MHASSDIDEPREGDARAELWRSVFEASEDAQLICTRMGRVHEINRKGAQLLGITNPAESSHVSVFDALSPAASKRLYEIFQRPGAPSETMSAIRFTPSVAAHRG